MIKNKQTYSFIKKVMCQKRNSFFCFRHKKQDISCVNTLDKVIQSMIEVDLQKNKILDVNNEK